MFASSGVQSEPVPYTAGISPFHTGRVVVVVGGTVVVGRDLEAVERNLRGSEGISTGTVVGLCTTVGTSVHVGGLWCT